MATTVAVEETDVRKEKKTWSQFDLREELLRGIYGAGFDAPSAIQSIAIDPILQKKDVIAQAQSGTGKTGTFCISALQRINLALTQPQVILVVPTRELALQSLTTLTSLAYFMEGLKVQLLVGGNVVQDDIGTLQRDPPHIVVACTGRLLDMIRRKALAVDNVALCILDEADELLSQGFLEQIQILFKALPHDVQIALFSATMPPEMLSITKRFMRDPVSITMKPEELNLEGIKQYVVRVRNDKDKDDVLKDLFDKLTATQTIIYANSVHRVTELERWMTAEGYAVVAIHSGMSKPDRSKIMEQFRAGHYKVLVSSNLTARGVDVQQVSTVVNYDVPHTPETYLHRIGRSGRWGRKGMAINFATDRDMHFIDYLQRYFHSTIADLPANLDSVLV